jgi:glutathione S-transferase
MGIIQTKSTVVNALNGLHLYHFNKSNCSMRVRLCLEEKGLAWTSHHIDLSRKENLTEAYFKIHPNGLVPTLVDDAQVVIESSDIMQYLEEHYTSKRLLPEHQDLKMKAISWVEMAIASHIRTLKTFVYMSNPAMAKSADEMQKYVDMQKDEELLNFHLLASKGIPDEEQARTVNEISDIWSKIDEELSHQSWLVGDEYSIADITWYSNFAVLNANSYSFTDYSNVWNWAGRISNRPAVIKEAREYSGFIIT